MILVHHLFFMASLGAVPLDGPAWHRGAAVPRGTPQRRSDRMSGPRRCDRARRTVSFFNLMAFDGSAVVGGLWSFEKFEN